MEWIKLNHDENDNPTHWMELPPAPINNKQ